MALEAWLVNGAKASVFVSPLKLLSTSLRELFPKNDVSQPDITRPGGHGFLKACVLTTAKEGRGCNVQGMSQLAGPSTLPRVSRKGYGGAGAEEQSEGRMSPRAEISIIRQRGGEARIGLHSSCSQGPPLARRLVPCLIRTSVTSAEA